LSSRFLINATSPINGPTESNIKTYLLSKDLNALAVNSMLNMVIAKPMQFTIVMALPLEEGSALDATIVENNGESAITVKPQIKRKKSKTKGEAVARKNGDNKQQQKEIKSAMEAILFTPYFLDKIPLNTQAVAPKAITRKDQNDIRRSPLCALFQLASIKGRKAQNVYSSHICPK
jgi:hypothetical protein